MRIKWLTSESICRTTLRSSRGCWNLSPLIKKVAILETKVKELEVQCASHADLFIFVDEEKIHLSKEPGKLQEELSNAEMRVVAKYSTSQEYHNDLGAHYVRGFEHFCT